MHERASELTVHICIDRDHPGTDERTTAEKPLQRSHIHDTRSAASGDRITQGLPGTTTSTDVVGSRRVKVTIFVDADVYAGLRLARVHDGIPVTGRINAAIQLWFRDASQRSQVDAQASRNARRRRK